MISWSIEFLQATKTPPDDPIFPSHLINLDISVKGKISLLSTSEVSHVSHKKKYLAVDIENVLIV